MKKTLTLIFLFVIALAVWAGFFYWKNLRGVWPAVLHPGQDIAQLIESTKSVSDNRVHMPLTLPPGFTISVFARRLGDPRVLAFDPAGNLLVSIPGRGKVVALPDRDHDGAADEVITVADGLERPHGLAFRCTPECRLYIAEENAVAVYDYDQKNLKAVHRKKIIDLPGGGNHITRTLLFMPPPDDKNLLISVGSSCNVCYEKDRRRAKVLVAREDGGDLRVFASGLRNAVFLAVHPNTKKIWVTEMGRDFLGDDLPPDEINIVEKGRDYGWPLCYGKNIHDTDFDKGPADPCKEPAHYPSYIDIPAHSAPLGLAFFPHEGWPREFWDNLLVSYHGSWNRSVPTGYKVVRYKLDAQGNLLGVEDFITGWLTAEGKSLGRPVDILIRPGGMIYISDDKAGVVYRVTYRKP